MCNLEDFKFVGDGAARAVVEVYYDNAPSELLSGEKEGEGWGSDRVGD